MIEQKNKKKNHDSQNCIYDSQFILTTLKQTFLKYQIQISEDFRSQVLREEQAYFCISKKFTGKQLKSLFNNVQILLLRELQNRLQIIIMQILQIQRIPQDIQDDIKALLIFYGLLKATSITDQNYFKMIKWIYQLCQMTEKQLNSDIAHTISAIISKIIKLGFLIIKKSQQIEIQPNINLQSKQVFKEYVTKLTQQKQAKIISLKFQICRVCEDFIPLNMMNAHLNQCEQIHQIQYIEGKLEEKGMQILKKINSLPNNSEQKYILKDFYDRLYNNIGEIIVCFKLRNCLEDVNMFNIQFKQSIHHRSQTQIQIIQLMQKYQQNLSKNYVDQTLSDKQSSKIIKSRKVIKLKIPSSTSLAHSNNSEYHSTSQKTIISDSDHISKYNTVKLSDFEILRQIGKGAYSEVYLVRKKKTQDLYAMKVIQIQEMNNQKIQSFKKQQKIYKSIEGGFNVKLYYSFSQDNLYFLILDYGSGGNLRTLLQNQVYFQQKYVKVYLANLILAINSIHQLGIVHRDLKPENIVINQFGHLILTDFNLSKLIKDNQIAKQDTFFGTPDYIAPQVLKGQESDQMIDWFSLGIIAYELVIGVTPFTAYTKEQVFQNILKGQIQWPEVGQGQGQISANCKNLIERFLEPNPKLRLGRSNSNKDQLFEIKNHTFFEGICWNKIQQHEYFYIPPKTVQQHEDYNELNKIKNKRRKASISLGDNNIVRYDILKSITNKNMKSHKNSRFKLQKQLQCLKSLPSSHKVPLKKNNSFCNFDNNIASQVIQYPGISCKDMLPNEDIQ